MWNACHRYFSMFDRKRIPCWWMCEKSKYRIFLADPHSEIRAELAGLVWVEEGGSGWCGWTGGEAAAPPSPEMGIGLLKWTWKCQGCQQQQRESQQSSELPVQKRLHCHFTSHSGLRLLRGAAPQKKVVGREGGVNFHVKVGQNIEVYFFVCESTEY